MNIDDTIKIHCGEDDIVEWITVKGQHIPIKVGQSKDSAIKDHFDKLKALKPPPVPGAYIAKVKEKEIAKLAKYQANPAASNKIMGLWAYDSNIGKLYKAIMAGDWHSLSQLQQDHITGKLTVKEYLKSIENTGNRTGQWTLERDKYAGKVRLAMKDFGNAAKGQVDITDKQQHAALTAVSKLMSSKGLDVTLSAQVFKEFMKDAGISSLAKVSDAVKSWTGNPTNEGGTWLRKVASEYYGRPWNSEYSGHDTGASKIKGIPLDPALREQMLAVKALGTAYAQASGVKYLYRGVDISNDLEKGIKLAKANGEEYVNIPINALSSWSTKSSPGFGDTLLRREVDPNDVWFANKAMAHLFESHQHEQEWILGTKDTFLKIKASDVKLPSEYPAPWEKTGQSVLDTNKSKYPDPDDYKFTPKIPSDEYKPTPKAEPLKSIDPKTGTDYLATKVSSAQGSNPGGTYTGSDGVDRYVKFYSDPKQGQGEALANTIYKDLGIGAPDAKIIPTSNGKEAYASTIIPGGQTLKQQGVSAEDAKNVLKGFAADVLTANWDAVGTGLDNILMSFGGKPYRIDNGGSFLYRAQGALKPESALHQLTEWDNFFSKNKYYADVAAKAGVTKADDVPGLKQQVTHIVNLRDSSGGWGKYIDMHAPYVKDKDKIATMLETRTKLLQDKVKGMKASIQGGGPGSGRKPSYAKGLNKWKSEEQERKAAAKDPKQKRLPLKAGEESVESESGPISKKLGKAIYKEGTQYCVYGDKDNLGCYPSKEKAAIVSRGGSFIEDDIKSGTGWDSGVVKPVGFIKKRTLEGFPKAGKGVGHKLTSPSMHHGKGVGHRFANPSFEAADIGSHIGHKMKEKGIKPVGHHLTSPSMKKGKGVGHRFANPSFNAYADYGEPMAGSMAHAHIEPNVWFTPPSLAKRGKGNHIPTDDPGEKDNKFLDVTKRNSNDTKEQRMKILKRGAPGGLPPQLPVHTTLVAPHTAAYTPGVFSSAVRRKRRNGGSFRAYGAAQI